MTYNSGNYSGTYQSGSTTYTGSIGTLRVAENSAGIDWGSVGYLNVQSTGRVGNFSMTDTVVYNHGAIDHLTYNSGSYTRGDFGTIGMLTIAGYANGVNWGSLDKVAVVSGGMLVNYGGNTITDASVGDDGILSNYGAMTNATVNLGSLYNDLDGTIDTVTVNGDGFFFNYSGTINNASLQGGATYNAGRIEDMSYTSGNYYGQYDGNAGSIGSLTVATNTRGIDWGQVDRLDILTSGIVESVTSTGTVNNNGRIDALTYSGGTYTGSGSIGTLNIAGNSIGMEWQNFGALNIVSGGLFENSFGTTLASAGLSGGTLCNEGRIDNLNYSGGAYNWGGGSIGMLNITGDSRGVEWGIVETLNNRVAGKLGDYTMVSGSVFNSGTADSLTILGGRVTNSGNAEVGMVAITGSGLAQNGGSAEIGLATVTGNGLLQNSGDAEIGTATVTSDGIIQNFGRGTIGSALVAGSGTLQNYGDAKVGSAVVTGSGMVQNYGSAAIGSLSLGGGAVSNGNRIENLTYKSGYYNGIYNGSAGSIGTLNVAGQLTGDNWGMIDDIVFDSNGSGIIHITASFNNAASFGNFGFFVANNDWKPGITFIGIQAENSVDLTNVRAAIEKCSAWQSKSAARALVIISCFLFFASLCTACIFTPLGF